jgi:tripartite-type tricarboxylate transporter receptor subunit TctC
MKTPRRKFLHLAAGAAALPTVSRFARAQSYPTRPVRWIVPFPAGGATDLVARIMSQWLTDRLGQPVIVENKPGAGTNLAVQAVVNSPPDGYTLLFAAATNAINASLYETLPFNFLRDITPVGGLATLPLVMDLNPSVPAKTIAEFIAYAKANPGKINMASFGTGTISHLAGELLKAMTGINTIHVPYRGGAPMVTDLLGGQVQVGFDALPSSLPHIRSGALRALGVTTATRSHSLPDVPTVGETISGYEVNGWIGVGAPAGTPPEVIERLNREINAGLLNPGIKARLAEVGTTPMAITAAEFGELVAADTEKWAKVIKFGGIKPE